MAIRPDDLTPTIPPHDPNPKKPSITLPPLACDSHFHVFGPHSKFPFAAKRPFTPTDAPAMLWNPVLPGLSAGPARDRPGNPAAQRTTVEAAALYATSRLIDK